MARLEPLTDASREFRTTICVPASGIILGRSVTGPGCLLLPVDWLQCSGKHCKFYEEEEKWYIKDLSRNGTLVNGQRIDKASPKELVEGDEITVSSNASLAAKAIHVMWKFTKESETPNGGHKVGAVAQEQPTTGKRKAEGPLPECEKRSRVSDGQTDWIMKNARLIKQLEVQSETHWKEMAQFKDQASARELALLGKVEALDTQLKGMESKGSAAQEVSKLEQRICEMGQRAGQLEMEAKAIADEKYVLTRERDAVEEELRGCKVALQVALTEGAAMKEALDVSIKHNQDLQARAREKEAAEAALQEGFDAKVGLLQEENTRLATQVLQLETKAQSAVNHAGARQRTQQTRIEELEQEVQIAKAREKLLLEKLEVNEDITRDLQNVFRRQATMDEESREWHSTQDHLMEEAVRLCIRDFEMQTQKLQGLIEEARQHKLIMGAQRHEQEAISRSLYECAFGLEQEGPRTQEDQVSGQGDEIVEARGLTQPQEEPSTTAREERLFSVLSPGPATLSDTSRPCVKSATGNSSQRRESPSSTERPKPQLSHASVIENPSDKHACQRNDCGQEPEFAEGAVTPHKASTPKENQPPWSGNSLPNCDAGTPAASQKQTVSQQKDGTNRSSGLKSDLQREELRPQSQNGDTLYP